MDAKFAALLTAIDRLQEFGNTLPGLDYQDWIDHAEPEAGDCRQLYLQRFLELDGAVDECATQANIWPRNRLAGYGVTGLAVDPIDGIPLTYEWQHELTHFRA